MAPPRFTKPYERETGSWSLPKWITKSICLRAGREASAALCVALGKHTGASAAHEATYYEPFTYWDWHGLGPDDTYAREWKRQRMWEHQRGFVVDGTKTYGYPTSRERWRRFTGDLDAHPRKKEWVKRIAVAHWMEMEDLYWVANNLTMLEGMDLSDIPAPYEDQEGFQHHSWEALLKDQQHIQFESMVTLLGGLTWLGLPDIRDPREHFAPNLMYCVLPRCTSLRTLSIRRVHSSVNIVDPHDYICKLPLSITTSAPPTLTKLELRLPLLPLDSLMGSLSRLKSSIKHISIDLGAWIQLSSEHNVCLKVGSTSLHEPEIKRTARTAAQAMRFTTYEKAHNETLRAEDKWWIPRSRFDEHTSEEEGVSGEVKHAFDRNFYCKEQAIPFPYSSMVNGDKNRSVDSYCNCRLDEESHEDKVYGHILDAKVSTVPVMLSNLYRAASDNLSFTISALEPEWQEQSTDPLHPFALLHKLAPEEVQQRRDRKDKYLSSDHYHWLNTTFNWRPVFDWDYLVNPSANDPEDNGCNVYEEAKKQFDLESLAKHDIVNEIADQFQLLKQAGIPLHILIGRRSLDTSSLYWGWPYNESTWPQWLDTPLDADLRTISPLIDTLSVMYDIRNPLDEHRLHSIKSLSPSTKTFVKTTCPRPLCPWISTALPCPFPKQWSHASPPPSHQKMANKHFLRTSNLCLNLAPHHPSLPPPGHSIPPNTQSSFEDSLTYLARDAAFKREALAWQRFWCTYAPSLTSLTELNVRMPRAFDIVKSVKLARLLDPLKGWHVTSYADEIGSDEDAGVFVRRTWIKKGKRGVEKISISDEGGRIEEREKGELVKGVNIARDAANAEQKLEVELKAKRNGKKREGDHISIEKRLESVYGRRIAHVAKQAWQRRIRGYVDHLAQEEIEQVDEDVKNVLSTTRARLERKIDDFRPANVFRRDVGMKEGIGLVAYTRDYSAEEEERRGWPVPEKIVAEAVDVAAGGASEVREDRAVEASTASMSEISDTSPLVVRHARTNDTRDILPVQDPEDRDDWDPYGSGTPRAQQVPDPALAPPSNAMDDVFKLLDVLREHGSSIGGGQKTTTQPLTPFQGYQAATPGPYMGQLLETFNVENFEGNNVVRQDTTVDTTVDNVASSYVHQTTEFEQQVQVEIPAISTPPVSSSPGNPAQPEQYISSRPIAQSKEASNPKRPTLSTNRKRPTPKKQSVAPKEAAPSVEGTPTAKKENASIPKEHTPRMKEPTLPTKEITPPPKQPTPPAKQFTPPPNSPTLLASTKRAPRNRKDPVISDNPPELETGRRLRSSRSATPAKSYKESSEDDDEEEEEKKTGKGKGKGKGKARKARKRAADKEWDGEGKRKKRKK